MYKELDKLKDVELPLWGKVRHPNIVTAFTLFENDGNVMYLMMQLADLGSISDYIDGKFVLNPKVQECVMKKVGEDQEKII
jgi:serine/threonine protein kinase